MLQQPQEECDKIAELDCLLQAGLITRIINFPHARIRILSCVLFFWIAKASISCNAGSKQIFFEQLDISDPASVKAFAKAVQDKHKEVSIVINNAGWHRLHVETCYCSQDNDCMLADLNVAQPVCLHLINMLLKSSSAQMFIVFV